MSESFKSHAEHRSAGHTASAHHTSQGAEMVLEPKGEEANEEVLDRMFGSPLLQPKLPPDGEAETKGYYNAQSKGTTIAYKGGRPVNFSTAFKMKMVKNEWGGAYDKVTDMWHVTTSGESKVVLPTNAIQIDHKTPWDSIEKELAKKPSTVYGSTALKSLIESGYVMSDRDAYSDYAARMYYHDVPNLEPMAGSENAAKGATAGVSGKLDLAWKNRAARSGGIHNRMVQAAFSQLKKWSHTTTSVTELLNKFDGVDAAMIGAEEFYNGY